MRSIVSRGYRAARKVVVAVIGGTLLLAGVLMLVLPGPAFVVIPAGLAVLAIEFTWARRLLRRAREQASALAGGSGARPSEAERR
jgi:tellurite resistance protein TerC